MAKHNCDHMVSGIETINSKINTQRAESNKTDNALWAKETQVLTNKGWTDKVQINDMVATYNFQTNKITFEPVTKRCARRGNQDELYYECTNVHAKLRALGGESIASKQKNSETEWVPIQIKNYANESVWSKVVVAGQMDFDGVDLDDNIIEFLGLIFRYGLWNPETETLQLSCVAGTDAEKNIEEHLQICNCSFRKISYDGLTVGNRARKKCKYLIWICQLTDKENLELYSKIIDYLDFEKCDLYHQFTYQQFQSFCSMLSDTFKAKQYTCIKIRHIEKERADKLQMMATLRSHKVVLELQDDGSYIVRIFSDNTSIIGSKGKDSGDKWKTALVEGRVFWKVETNGGGIVTRFNGCTMIMNGVQSIHTVGEKNGKQ